MEINNVYIPTTTAGSLQTSGICSGCGKCNTCGRPYHEVPHTPTPLQPFWSQPQFTYTAPNYQGGQSTLEQSAVGGSLSNSSNIGIVQSPNRCVAINNSQMSYPEDK